MMNRRINELARAIRKAGSERQHILSRIEQQREKADQAKTRADNAIIAKEIVLSVAELTQSDIGKRVSELTSLALASVWEDPYDFEVEFVQRRGVTEADLWFVRRGHKIEPLAASGGGTVDIASLGLRLAVWSLNKTAAVFILDEPFRNLSLDMHIKASIMLQTLSKQLEIQIIMAAASDDMIAGADRVFRLTDRGITQET